MRVARRRSGKTRLTACGYCLRSDRDSLILTRVGFSLEAAAIDLTNYEYVVTICIMKERIKHLARYDASFAVGLARGVMEEEKAESHEEFCDLIDYYLDELKAELRDRKDLNNESGS